MGNHSWKMKQNVLNLWLELLLGNELRLRGETALKFIKCVNEMIKKEHVISPVLLLPH